MTTTAPRTTGSTEDRRRIDQYLRETRLDGAGTQVIALTGDASDRRYYRIVPPDGGTSLVLALHPGPIDFASLPFANVAGLLQTVPLPVPTIAGHSDPLGIVALDDLGDVTLQAQLEAATAAERSTLYRQAVGYLESLQRRGAEIDPGVYLPYRLAFDVEKLTWELDFFLTHFVGSYRGAAPSASQRAALGEEFGAIARELAAEPRVLCHRDYHSRNLMVRADGLYIIDFQDARMGPDTYDLVSLLRDSYVDLEERELEDLMAHFLALKGGTVPSADEFRRRFDLMSVQRNLKALGTFGFQTVTRSNPAYLQSMPRTLRYVRENVAKYPRFARLRALLTEIAGL